MKRIHAGLVLSALMATLLAACATPATGPMASADLQARSGSSVSGKVTFTEMNGRLRVDAQVAGLTPGEHGFHVHEAGDCSAPDASSAKGHFNPAGKAHGHHASPEHHGGDMPNLVANANGEARFSGEIDGLSLNGRTGVMGRSIVIHADPDDYKSQPAGNSGKRVACGVIASR
ncbi:MAG TPA: superoxide dismutase family protein [Azonexus sp.]|nr:superoxide dismutase family protein [Azonexus sp.]